MKAVDKYNEVVELHAEDLWIAILEKFSTGESTPEQQHLSTGGGGNARAPRRGAGIRKMGAQRCLILLVSSVTCVNNDRSSLMRSVTRRTEFSTVE